MSAPGRRREQLIERRRHLGFTQESLAHALDVSTSSVAQWERGAGTPTPRHRRRLADLLEVGLAGLDQLLDPGADPIEVHHSAAPWMGHGLSLEQAASEVRTVDLTVVPPLLQVRSYAEAVLRARYFQATDDQIQARIETWMARQNALVRAEDPLRLRAVLDESILLRPVGSYRVMVDQIDHLLRMMELPTVEMRILALDGPGVGSVPGPFWLLTKPGDTAPFLVCTENAAASEYREVRSLVEDHDRLFEHLERVSMSAIGTVERLGQARKRYR